MEKQWHGQPIYSHVKWWRRWTSFACKFTHAAFDTTAGWPDSLVQVDINFGWVSTCSKISEILPSCHVETNYSIYISIPFILQHTIHKPLQIWPTLLPALVLFPVAEVPPNPTEGGDLQLLPAEDSQPSASEVRLIWKTCADIKTNVASQTLQGQFKSFFFCFAVDTVAMWGSS